MIAQQLKALSESDIRSNIYLHVVSHKYNIEINLLNDLEERSGTRNLLLINNEFSAITYVITTYVQFEFFPCRVTRIFPQINFHS